jgi:hypothetical protein
MIKSLHANDGRNNMGIFASVGRAAFVASRPARIRRERAPAAKRVMPMAVRTDRRFLYAAVRLHEHANAAHMRSRCCRA